ncbi:MAG: hypothetical protein M4579_005123 [Chaenotheca gracillima]|nr:MAG: hypothetical protein M4579_005123 [Chaenotheca gracillima]
MAGIERLEIHSRSYLIRWVNVSPGHTISWTIQPLKKSVNFGIFKRPKGATSAHNLSSSTLESPPTPGQETRPNASRKTSRNESSTAIEQLQSEGLVPTRWLGKCEADKVSTGTYDVGQGQGGMYALAFDNTFSKQVSKTVTIVILTYPTNSPPKATHHQHHLHSLDPQDASQNSKGHKGSGAGIPVVNSIEPPTDSGDKSEKSRPLSRPKDPSRLHTSPNLYTGVLRKRRRKRHQGFARRFFSLDYTSSTLSYYHDRRSLALRGSIPLSLAAIGANGKTREISIDSGAEVWHLRAGNQRDFDGWKKALGKACESAHRRSPSTGLAVQTSGHATPTINIEEETEWVRVEALVSRVAGTRDAMRRLMAESESRRSTPRENGKLNQSPEPSPTESSNATYFEDGEKRPFWKRKASSGNTTPAFFRRTTSSQLVPPQAAVSPLEYPSNPFTRDESLHAGHAALLHDLDSLVGDFTALLSSSKQRRAPMPISATSRHSLDSLSPTEFFDADDGDGRESRLLVIRDEDDDGDASSAASEYVDDEDDDEEDKDSITSSEAGSPERGVQGAGEDGGYAVYFPPRSSSLTPLPLERVKRRPTVPVSKVQPPSLIGFLRKNVGKDLSTISMPVSANEPTSLLQRAAEQMEYSSLLDEAGRSDPGSAERLLLVTAFAVSSFSNNRVKERSIRKPFNPMLGETFEAIREDRGYRFLAEKVSHRPVRMACHAESKEWTFSQSPMPVQKFWGKSAELNTDGPARVLIHPSAGSGQRECFSWTQASCFLRNIIAGEKYIEPVATMTVLNDTTGQKAIVTFKAKGMFSGRSEEVDVQVFDRDGSELSLGLTGKWTSSLSFTSNGAQNGSGAPVWSVGSLVDNPSTHYGMTTFAASLNEITAVEDTHLPPTDSRLRPDQRAAEQGDLDLAETVKAKLEDRQRIRRKQLEEEGRDWAPQWFEKASGQHPGEEEVWRLKRGEDGYWERRAKGAWDDVTDVLAF